MKQFVKRRDRSRIQRVLPAPLFLLAVVVQIHRTEAQVAPGPPRAAAAPVQDQEERFRRWEKAIAAFEARDRESPTPRHAVLFAGSSSIVRWDLKQAFPDMTTINRGFGGSEIADSTHFAGRIIVPARPRTIVFYAGDNDLARGRSPEQVRDDFRSFVATVRQALPETKIIFIGIKPSPARWRLVEQQKEANRLIEADCRSDPRLVFIDTFPAMLGDDDRPRPGLFGPDNLHMGARGYAIWNALLKPVLK